MNLSSRSLIKVWNVIFYFLKVEYVQYLGKVNIFHTWVQKFIPFYNSAKIIKIDRDFPKLWSQMYCHLFMVHSVDGILIIFYDESNISP